MLHGSFHLLHPAIPLRTSSEENPAFVSPLGPPFQVKLASSSKFHVRSLTISVPAINPDDPQPPVPPQPPSITPAQRPKLIPNVRRPPSSPRSQEWRLYANNNGKNGRWYKENESHLSKDEALPLPMAYPGSTPNPQEVEEMKNCDPEKKDCKDILYQWVGKCSRCQGTGEVSYFRKKGRETICKCISCMGLGYVHKMTRRQDIEVNEELDGAV